MIKAEELIDGSGLVEIFTDLADALIDVFLAIIVACLELAWDWIQSIFDQTYFGSNPAVLLIGIIIIVTAFLIWRRPS